MSPKMMRSITGSTRFQGQRQAVGGFLEGLMDRFQDHLVAASIGGALVLVGIASATALAPPTVAERQVKLLEVSCGPMARLVELAAAEEASASMALLR